MKSLKHSCRVTYPDFYAAKVKLYFIDFKKPLLPKNMLYLKEKSYKWWYLFSKA